MFEGQLTLFTICESENNVNNNAHNRVNKKVYNNANNNRNNNANIKANNNVSNKVPVEDLSPLHSVTAYKINTALQTLQLIFPYNISQDRCLYESKPRSAYLCNRWREEWFQWVGEEWFQWVYFTFIIDHYARFLPSVFNKGLKCIGNWTVARSAGVLTSLIFLIVFNFVLH